MPKQELIPLNVLEISGSMGGSKPKTPPPPGEDPDTLASKQIARLLFAINDGSIKDSVPEVYLNGAPAGNFDVEIEWRRGLQNQPIINGFSDVESPMPGLPSGGIEILKTTPYISPELASDVSAVRVTLLFTQLRRITTTGDRIGYSVSHNVFVRKVTVTGGIPSYGSWALAVENTKKGKATNPYAWDIRITPEKHGLVLASGDRWQFRVDRITEDDSVLGDRFYSATYVKSVTQIYEASNYSKEKLSYPGTALIGITLKDPSQFGNSFPEIAFRSYLTELYLPAGYDPIARTYPVTWLGNFSSSLQWSDNLSWAIYNSLCRHPSGFLLNPADIDSGSFYLFAKYCDELVPDGQGGMEPRYRIDIHFTERSNRNTYMTYLLSLGNAMFTQNLFGQIAIAWDRPGQEFSHTVSNATVVGGKFTWFSNDVEARTSVVNVTYNDELAKGLTDTVTQVGDDENLVAGKDLFSIYGIQTADIVLQGCIRKSQALRKARLAIWANCIDTELVTFRLLFEGNTFFQGQKIYVLDQEEVSNSFYHAILKNITFTGGISTLTFDRSFTLTPANARVSTGKYYLLGLNNAGTEVVEYQINETDGEFSQLTVSSAVDFYFPGDILLQGKVRPWEMKVVYRKLDGDEWEITALKHSEEKFAYIDTGYSIIPPEGSYVDYDSYTTEAPVNLAVQQFHVNTSNTVFTKLEVSWDWDLDFSAKYYVDFYASYTRDDLGYKKLGPIGTRGFEIEEPVPGIYSIIVWAVNKSTGVPSQLASIEYAYRVTAGTSTLNPPLTLLVENTAGTTFSEPNCALYLQFDPDNHFKTDALKDYKVEILHPSTLTVVAEYYVPTLPSLDGKFNFTYELNRLAFGGLGSRSFYVKAYSRDLVGDLSAARTALFSNPAPNADNFSFTSTFGTGAVYFNITASTETDVIGYIVQRSVLGDFTDALEVYKGPDTTPVVPGSAGVVYYYRLAAFDTFGPFDLDWSTAVSGAMLTADVSKYTYTGLLFSPNNPTLNILSWGTFSVYKNGILSANVVAGSATWTTGTLFIYFSDGDTTLNSTTDILVAVSGQIIATYRGGTDLTHDNGRAFIDGNLIFAGTIGANQLVTNTAIITEVAQIQALLVTEAHLANASISNAKIKDIIQSSDYNETTFNGWKIDKAGDITSYGSLSIKDSSGADILTTGPSAGIKWDKILDKTSWASLSGITVANASTYIAAGAINNLMFDRATGNKLSVGTLDIQGQAVTVPVSSYSAEAIPTPQNVLTFLQSAAIFVPSPAFPVTLLYTNTGGGTRLRLYYTLNGGVENLILSTGEVSASVLSIVHYPPAGTINYIVRGSALINGLAVSNRTITLLGTKR